MAELFTEVLSWVSPEIFGRAVQLRNTVKTITTKLGTKTSWETEMAATLCQIGMLAISSEILTMESEGKALSDRDKKAMESVPAVSHELLERIPQLENVARIVLYQNKHFNGDGFPGDPITGKELPLGSRILKVAADYHELRAAGQSRQETITTMQSRDGWYDPGVLNALVGESPSTEGSIRDEASHRNPL